ncbi:MAG: cupin domain-containing protein [Actinomycetota bacterium]
MTSRHVVRRSGEAIFSVPGVFAKNSRGFGRWTIVDERVGVHTGFGLCELAPGGSISGHVHSFEETFHVLEGGAVFDTPGRRYLLRPGDYGLVPVGVRHAWRNDGSVPARWAEMQAPQPRSRHGEDTFLVPPVAGEGSAVEADVRDPRTRSMGHIEPANMDPDKQTQDMLALSASMRTALLVYSGITVKMMVDADLGAQLSTMFMVQYRPGGLAGTHDHPFEETYLILEGEVDAVFDDRRYRLAAGDVAFSGVGCVHGFSNPAKVPVRWLETQAPQPPARHSYRFTRDWDYLRDALEGGGGASTNRRK